MRERKKNKENKVMRIGAYSFIKYFFGLCLCLLLLLFFFFVGGGGGNCCCWLAYSFICSMKRKYCFFLENLMHNVFFSCISGLKFEHLVLWLRAYVIIS